MTRSAWPVVICTACAVVSVPQCQQAPYPRDVTGETLADDAELGRVESPGTVFFQEGFEAEACLERWYNRVGEEQGLVKVVTDGEGVHSGQRGLRLEAVDRDGQSSGAGVDYWFPPGYETVHFRRYIKFGDDYDQGNLNHVGGSLYAVASDDRWAEMGKAGVRPAGDDRFGASFEPWRAWGRNSPPGAMMLYTYWMDMQRDPDGHYWGSNLTPPQEGQVVLERGRWYCLEHMIKANTPGEPDGEMAAWIDGELYIHLTGFRWRTAPQVKLKRVGLGLYIHQSRRANTVWYDDVALSDGYIGRLEGR